MMDRVATITFMTVVAAAYAAAGQNIATKQATAAPDARDSVYEGVTPTGVNPPAVNIPAGSKPPQVTWPGFEMLATGGSRVFLQLTGRVETELRTGPDRVVLVLKNARIAGRNNKRPLETSFFSTPVNRAWLQQRGVDAELTIELRVSSQPSISAAQAATGYYFVLLEFPAGAYRPPDQPEKLSNHPAATATGKDSINSTPNNPSIEQSRAKPAEKPLTQNQLRAIEEEKPPILQRRVRGSIHIGH
jgi:hypothetical protein